MRLQKLTLENFQGIKGQTLEFPDGCSGSIYGDNATGKTTVYNALTWLLFDKASTGAKGFTPQTRGPEGELHHLNHIAEGEFITDAGQVVILKKDYHENWKKKRGATEAELAGHVTDYSINGVPVKEAEYNETVLNYCGGDAEKLKILTMPDYFPEAMKWQDRRQILLDVCGDLTDEEIIGSNKDLQELHEFLKIPGEKTTGIYSIDEFRKITAARRKEINQKLDSIPARIDEAQRAIPDTDGLDKDELVAKQEAVSKEIESLMAQKAEAKAGNNYMVAVHEEIANIKAEIAKQKAAFLEAQNEKAEKQNEAVRAKMEEVNGVREHIANGQRAKEQEEAHLKAMRKQREELLEEWKTANALRWNPDSEYCPACGQKYPADKIQEKVKEFNLRRSNSLAQISESGKTTCSKEMISEAEQKIKGYEAKISERQAALDVRLMELETIRGQAEKPEPFEGTEQYKELNAKLADLLASEGKEEDEADLATKAIQDKIDLDKEKYRELSDKIARFTARASVEERVKKLQAELRELGAEFEHTEKGLHLADLFVKTKVSALTERINSRFQTVSFQLFTDQVNGGLKEGCEVLVPGEGGRMIPYAYANNAARINAGLEIIDTLSKHWGIQMPVVIDNCEAVSHPLEIGTQEIRLYVSEPDKSLRLVTEDK